MAIQAIEITEIETPLEETMSLNHSRLIYRLSIRCHSMIRDLILCLSWNWNFPQDGANPTFPFSKTLPLIGKKTLSVTRSRRLPPLKSSPLHKHMMR